MSELKPFQKNKARSFTKRTLRKILQACSAFLETHQNGIPEKSHDKKYKQENGQGHHKSKNLFFK